MMLLLDFAVACVDCTGGNKKKTHGNRFNNNIDREYLSVNNNNLYSQSGIEHVHAQYKTYKENCFLKYTNN